MGRGKRYYKHACESFHQGISCNFKMYYRFVHTRTSVHNVVDVLCMWQIFVSSFFKTFPKLVKLSFKVASVPFTSLGQSLLMHIKYSIFCSLNTPHPTCRHCKANQSKLVAAASSQCVYMAKLLSSSK